MPGHAGGLPPPVVPFAVRPVGSLRPDIWPLDRDPPPHVDDPGPTTVLRLDAEVPTLVQAKLTTLAADAAPWTAVDAALAPSRAVAAGFALAQVAQGCVPRLVTTDTRSVTVPGAGIRVDRDGTLTRVAPDPAGVTMATEEVFARLAAVPPQLRPLEAVALSVGEDLVLVDAEACAVWVHVCAPSGWDPGAAAGAALAALHGPIPDADRLRAASGSLGRAITGSGPHVRWTWGLTEDAALARHARALPPPRSLADPGELTFRAERQTTVPLPGSRLGAFTIRVHRAPLADVVTTAARRDALAETITTLPPGFAAYKGVTPWRDRLLDWLADLDLPAPAGRDDEVGGWRLA